MQCLLCGKKIPLLRKLKDPDFCSEAHRDEYAQTQSSLALSRLLESTRGVPVKAPVAELVAAGGGGGGGGDAVREEPSEREALAAVSRATGPKELYLELSGNEPSAGMPAPRKVTALPVRTRFVIAAPRMSADRIRRRAPEAGLVELTTAPLVSGTALKLGETSPLDADLEVALPLHEAETQSIAEPAHATETPPAPKVPLPSNWVAPQPVEAAVAMEAMAPLPGTVSEPKPPSGPLSAVTPPKIGDPSSDPPLARATGWPEKWTAGWRPRNQVFDMRRLWALPLIQAGSRAPQIRPAFAVDLELLLVSDPVASALTSGTGMLGLRPPRSKPPLPPTLAKRARGKESLIVRPPALRADALVSVFPRPAFALGADSLPKLIVAAEGRRAAMELLAWPAMPDGLSGVPLVAPRLRGHIVLAGRVRVELPEAEWGNEAIWVAPEPQPFPSQSAGFGTLRLPPILFDPPLNGLLALRIYPRSAGSPGEWKRSELPSGIDLRFVGVSIPDSGLQPEKDWIGVGAGCVPLHVPALPANRLPFPGRMDPESGGALPKLPAAGSCRLGLAPIKSVSTHASRMRPLRRGPEARQHPAPIVAVPPEPGFRLRTPIKVRLKVAPKAECLNKPVKPPKRRLKLTLPPIFGPLKKRIRKIPRRTRVGALGLATAAMLALIFWQPSNPGKTQVGSPTRQSASRGASPPKANASWFQDFKGKLAARSAVAVTDDFSHGLADWEGRGDWAANWGYDNAGFVRTGPLAIFTPTRVLSDYRMEFVGQIERRSLGWVVRAADLSNYWALRLVVGGTDARPTVTLARYPVIRGVAGRIVERTVDLPLQADTTYRVTTDVSGDNYAVTVQGKVADSWTDSRLDRGGVGFFNNRGEQARVRWVGVWHQYDTLGRLCALLSSNSLLGNEREE